VNNARVLVTVAILAGAGCGSDDAPNVKSASRPATIVGRWERVQTCQELSKGLEQADLEALAPVVLGDFFPGASPRQLAAKSEPCEGARPRRHSHFFTKYGAFGSLDENGERVDDGQYRVVDGHTLRIGDGAFSYRILHGDTLILSPVISAAARRRALANPQKFSTAGWQVAVSYAGLPWKRMPCGAWC
jgi:hypothetical protein